MGARVSDHGSSTVVVESTLIRDEEIVYAHNQGVQVPTPDGGLSSLSTHTERTIMPQLDGPASACPQRRPPMPTGQRTTIPDDDGFPDDSNSSSHDIQSHDNRRYQGRRCQRARGERPPDRDDNQGRGYPGRGGPPNDGGLPDDGGPPDNGGPPDGGGPPGNGRPPRRPP